MVKSKERQIAKKLWIKKINEGEFVKQEGWEPNYILVEGEQVSRANVLATVVSKMVSDDGNFGAITLDDGSDTIRVKAFGPDVSRIKTASVGMLARVVGKVKSYNDEVYLTPEIIRKIDDPNWLCVHRLELGGIVPRSSESDEATESEKPAADKAGTGELAKAEAAEKNPTVRILELIKELDSGKGADVDAVIGASGLDFEDAKSAVIGLLSSGEIFEPKKGKLKVLD